MSERQKLFLICIFDVAGMILLLHIYPHYLVVGLLSLGIGALVVVGRVWWRHKLRSAKSLHPPTPEPPAIEDEQLANYLWTMEFDEFTSDLLLDLSIGDRTCKYNAHSPYLRCAVTPDVDTCEGCRHYEPLE
jgi:Family of unknown function (DUF6464)